MVGIESDDLRELLTPPECGNGYEHAMEHAQSIFFNCG
jgi:hypothetical protein